MGANLEALFQLQGIETQIAEGKRGFESRRRQLTVLARRVEQHLLEHETTVTRAREKQAAADALELEVKTYEANINRLREVLNRAKSNKEYAAVLSELNMTKADNSKREEQALRMMSEVDAVREQAKVQLAQYEKEKQRLSEMERSYASRDAEMGERMAELQARRDEVTVNLLPQVLITFERVAAKHEGEGLAEVVQINPRRHEYSCGGCSMAVTLEQVNMLAASDKMVTCNFCGRILHLVNGAPTAG